MESIYHFVFIHIWW